tara:strand:+ start:40 stop:648 length:609 start_codon:yes stop_codon:yes gene_type:complete
MNKKSIFLKLEFIKSAGSSAELPDDVGLEIAVCGRSNSGKSSILNVITENKNLAKTSKRPGRTQTMNVFSFKEDPSRRIVDLPGYGYAQVSKKMRFDWGNAIDKYLNCRQSLVGLLIIMDIRHIFQNKDLELINWSNANNMPVKILLNKADKISRNKSMLIRKESIKILNQLGSGSEIQIFSNRLGIGIKELRVTLSNWLEL